MVIVLRYFIDLAKRVIKWINDSGNKKKSLACYKYYENHPNVPSLKWINALGQTVYLLDKQELGKIEAINHDLTVVVNYGSINVARYYLLHSMIRRNQENRLCIEMTRDEASLYTRDQVPNPSNFATLGCSSYFAYPPIPYLDQEREKEY